jgi:hypothetical protein
LLQGGLPLSVQNGATHAAPSANRPSPTAAAIAEYRKKLEEYEAARAAFEAVATPYWDSVAEKRRTRIAKRRKNEPVTIDDYAPTQPPVYRGPRRPVDPSAPLEEVPERPPVPVVADFLAAAKEQFKFVPQRPRSEIEYKRTYARIASAAGLTRDQAVRVYGFESGGNGKYDVQAGLEYSKNGHAISTALGYNQLLTANTIDILSRKGAAWVKRLQAELPRRTGAAKKALTARIAALRRMTTAARSVPYRWSAHVKLGRQPEGLGIHALNLDIDIGPLLQTQKLLDSVLFARAKGYPRPLTAAELEMMNLTGDGNGFDMVTMPGPMGDKVPTSNFHQRVGYERNPVAARKETVARLLAATDAKMDREEKLPGAKDLAAAFPQLGSGGPSSMKRQDRQNDLLDAFQGDVLVLLARERMVGGLELNEGALTVVSQIQVGLEPERLRITPDSVAQPRKHGWFIVPDFGVPQVQDRCKALVGNGDPDAPDEDIVMVDDGDFQAAPDEVVHVDRADIAVELAAGFALGFGQIQPWIGRQLADIQRKIVVLLAATAAGPGMLHPAPILQGGFSPILSRVVHLR